MTNWISTSHLLLEHHYRQGRQVEQQRVLLSVTGDRPCHPAAEISLIGSPVNRGVAVQHLAPISLVWNANPVSSPRHRSEIARQYHRRSQVLGKAHVGEDAVIGVVGIDPAPTTGDEISLVQRRLAAVEGVQ